MARPRPAPLDPMRHRRIWASLALVVMLVLSLVGTGAFDNFAMSTGESQGDVVRQFVTLGTFALLLFGQMEASATRRPMAIPFSLYVLLGWCLLSVTWAVDPGVSIRRLALTALVIWIVVRAVGDLGAVRTLTLMRWVMVAVMLVSFAFVAWSDYGIHTATLNEAESVIGDWRGIMPHKNIAGVACAVTVLLFLFDRGRIPRAASVAVIAPTLVFLWYSNSKTSIGMLALAIGWGCLMRLYNPRHRSLVWPVALVVLAGTIGLAAMYSGAIETMLNDPSAFTGRGAIWPLLLDYSADHRWTGAGFGSFWQIGSASPIWQLTNDWVAKFASHGHNGYLDLLVTTGLPGLVLAVAILLVWPALLLLLAEDIARPRRALLGALIVFCAGHNMTESTLLDRTAAVEVVLLVVIALTHRLSAQSMGRHQRLRAALAHRLARRFRLRSGRHPAELGA